MLTEKRINKFLNLIRYLVIFLLGLVTPMVYDGVTSIAGGRTIQRLDSPDQKHQATLLKRYNLADMNFIVRVDGRRIFESPDYMGYADGLYRETLIWDEQSKLVVLELMGKRVFAYDVTARREIRGGEIHLYKFPPSPTENNYASIKDVAE